uniref:Uncharacterized protein n=1 Tax=Arundo donax TaxID=35708 RepID=A0A0A9BSE6_ARUDO
MLDSQISMGSYFSSDGSKSQGGSSYFNEFKSYVGTQLQDGPLVLANIS